MVWWCADREAMRVSATAQSRGVSRSMLRSAGTSTGRRRVMRPISVVRSEWGLMM